MLYYQEREETGFNMHVEMIHVESLKKFNRNIFFLEILIEERHTQ